MLLTHYSPAKQWNSEEMSLSNLKPGSWVETI